MSIISLPCGSVTVGKSTRCLLKYSEISLALKLGLNGSSPIKVVRIRKSRSSESWRAKTTELNVPVFPVKGEVMEICNRYQLKAGMQQSHSGILPNSTKQWKCHQGWEHSKPGWNRANITRPIWVQRQERKPRQGC